MAKAAAYWVKLNTDIWETNDAIKLIDSRPDADAILVIFFKLLTHAGKSNADGRLLINGFIPLEAEDLPGLIKRPADQVEKALAVLARYGLVSIEDGVEVTDWHEYVNADVMAELRKKNRERVAKHRQEARQRKEAETSGNDVTLQSHYDVVTSNVTGNGHQEVEKEELENKEKDNASVPSELKPDPIPYAAIIDYLNEVCGTAFKNAEGHKKHIRGRWGEGHRLEDFKYVIDVMFEEWGEEPRPGKKDMRPYLRPETLFGTKFDSYRQMKRKPNGRGPNGGGTNGGKQGSEGSAGLGSYVIG